MSDSTTYDAVVVGAGPAGSTTARQLASRGVRVALVDRAEFPRDKACGDLLAPLAVASLNRLGLSDFVEAHAPHSEWPALLDLQGHLIPYQIETHWPDGRAKWLAIRRRELDAALVRHAQEAGAVLYERTAVDGLSVAEDGVSVDVLGVSGSKLKARMAIVATGSSAKFARGQARFFAVRGYYEAASDQPLRLSWDADLTPGYEWQFPTTETGVYNVGIYTHHSEVRRIGLHARLETSPFTAGKELTAPLKGGLVNVAFATDRITAHGNRMLWVGDAAGLAQPHFGEGISPALRSGEIAAEVAFEALNSNKLDDSALSAYTQRLHMAFDRELRFSRLFYWIARHPRLFGMSARFLRRFYSLSHRSIIGTRPAANPTVQRRDELGS